MRFRVSAVLAIAVSSSLAGAAAPMPSKDEPVSLKPNYTPGYEARIVMETTRSFTQRLGMPLQDGKVPENTTSGEQKVGFLMKVVRSDDSGAVVTFRIDDIDFVAKSSRGEFAWKSTDPRKANDNANQALTTMRPALGATITFTFDKDGNILSSDNGGVNMPTGGFVDFIRLVVGNQETRARWSPILSPRKGDFMAAPGQSWTITESMNNPPLGKFTQTTELTLKSADEKSARIDVAGNFALGATDDGGAPTFNVESSSITGHIEWDRTVGLFSSAELHQTVELKGAAQGLPISFKTDTKIKFRREPVPATKAE